MNDLLTIFLKLIWSVRPSSLIHSICSDSKCTSFQKTTQQQTIRLLRINAEGGRETVFIVKDESVVESIDMELFEAIKNRRSIRTYRKQELTQKTINQLIDAACSAPSAGNAQSWAFVVATEQKTKEALATAAFGQKWLEEASVVFVVCADVKRAEESYGERGRTLYSIQDTSAAIQNILLLACSMGLGTCWMGAFSEDEIRKVINAPAHMKPVALIPVGYPNESPRARSRRPVSEVVFRESF